MDGVGVVMDVYQQTYDKHITYKHMNTRVVEGECE